MVIRTQIWNTLVDLRFKGFVLGYTLQKFQKLERKINIFLAVASSGSIAAWAIWKEVPMLWAAIIALSQIVTVIKPYLPFYKYVKELNAKCLKLDVINLEFERLWNKIQRNTITEDSAETALYDLKKQIIDILSFNDDTFFDVSDDIKNKSNQRVKTFLKTNYSIDIQIQ